MPMAMTPRATPTPIPASAPVDNFELACAIDVCEVLLEAEDVPLVLVDVVGRSELCQLIWIMGAYILNAVIVAAVTETLLALVTVAETVVGSV